MAKNSRPVYSTETGRLCPGCAKPIADCQCRSKSLGQPPVSGQGVTVWRESKGRGGKEVTVIRNLPLSPFELQLLASTLKKHCGSGGTVNQSTIEIQGDQRDRVLAYLIAAGYRAKLAGG